MGALTLRAKLLAAFTAPLALAGLAALGLYRVQGLDLTASERVARDQEVIATTNALLGDVALAESEVRGFALTGDGRCLDRQRAAMSLVSDDLLRLRKLAPSASVSLVRIARMEHLFQRWHAETALPIIAARQAAPVALVRASQSAHLKLLDVRHLGAVAGKTRSSHDKELWFRSLGALEEQLGKARAASPSAGAGPWVRAIALAASYEAAFLAWTDARRVPVSPGHDELATALAALLQRELETVSVLEAAVDAQVGRGPGAALVQELRQVASDILATARTTLAGDQIASLAAARGSAAVALAGPGIALLVGLGAVLLVAFRIGRSATSVSGAARRLAAGDLTQRAEVASNDEVGDVARTFNHMAERLASAALEVDLLNEMGGLLQACHTAGEAHAIAGRAGQQLFPGASGTIYVAPALRGPFVPVASWPTGEGSVDPVPFAAEQCWGLRCGRTYVAREASSVCGHAAGEPSSSLCIPLAAQGETIGLLHLAARGPGSTILDEHHRRLAETMAHHVVLALANLKLREILRDEATHDVLTGLYNRRFMEEALGRELSRADRTRASLGLLMIDLDHFKRCNDELGHAAGDVLLHQMGALLHAIFRGSDIACRFGGEEFVLVLPGASENVAMDRAEELRRRAREIQVVELGALRSPVTLSIGVAVFPQHGTDADGLVRAADAALYRAKLDGRNRVALARQPEPDDDRTPLAAPLVVLAPAAAEEMDPPTLTSPDTAPRHGAKAGHPPTAISPARGEPRSSVLVVEDDELTREQLAELLRLEGHDVAVAGDGHEALGKLRSGLKPQVILLDLAMPGMNGWEFRATQSQDPELSLIPVVIVTGADEAMGLASIGGAPLLTKPVDYARLRRTVEAYC